MNIFFLSLIPRYAARYHCDKHVVKMILECCQMLWMAFHITGKRGWELNVPDGIKIYKPMHRNHPCTIWVRTHPNNFRWLAELADCLCRQYEKRYNKVHACRGMVSWFLKNTPKCNSKDKAKPGTQYAKYNYPPRCTPPPLCVAEECKHKDLVKSYRHYYHVDKYELRKVAEWRYTKTPYWWKY